METREKPEKPQRGSAGSATARSAATDLALTSEPIRPDDRAKLEKLKRAKRRNLAKTSSKKTPPAKTPPAKTRQSASKSSSAPTRASQEKAKTKTPAASTTPAQSPKLKSAAKTGEAPASTKVRQPAAKAEVKAKAKAKARENAKPEKVDRILWLHARLLDHLDPIPERVATGVPRLFGGSLEHYQANVPPRKLIRWSFEMIQDRIPGSAFVDLDALRGRTVLEACRFPFQKIIGYAQGAENSEIAALNARQFPRSLMQCRDVDIVRGSSSRAGFPKSNLVVFSFRLAALETERRLLSKLVMHAKAGFETTLIAFDPLETVFLKENANLKAVPVPKRLKQRFQYLSPYPVLVFTVHAQGEIA